MAVQPQQLKAMGQSRALGGQGVAWLRHPEFAAQGPGRAAAPGRGGLQHRPAHKTGLDAGRINRRARALLHKAVSADMVCMRVCVQHQLHAPAPALRKAKGLFARILVAARVYKANLVPQHNEPHLAGAVHIIRARAGPHQFIHTLVLFILKVIYL